MTGKKIGIVGFSASIAPDLYLKATKFLHSVGYKTEAPFDPSSSYGSNEFLFAAADVTDRIKAFSTLLRDPNVAAIIAARGAYGSMELLADLDYQAYQANPLPVIGLSDTSALLFALNKHVPTAKAVHGGSIQSAFARAGENADALRSAQAVLQLIEGKYQPIPQQLRWLCGGKLSRPLRAPIVGGNLSMLVSLVGTPWQVELSNKILFIEEVNEKPYRVHRALLQLKLAGCFEKLQAVLLGDFITCEHPKNLGPSLDMALKDIFDKCHFPVFKGLACGHADLNLPIVLGSIADLSIEGELNLQ